MTEEAFMSMMREVLGTGVVPLSRGTPLSELKDWDSLAVVTFIAAVDRECGVAPEAPRIASARTVGELFALVQKEPADT